MTAEPLVTVIVPAFNAEATIDRTLNSVRVQTHCNLEILVVDDGSADLTAAIVENHAAADPRVRLIRQANAGVAAARNRAIAEARGEFIAPIDADDLWRPTKIEKHLAAMLAGGPKVGLVYAWQIEIDEQDMVISTAHRPRDQGNVFVAMLACNLVGSGSNALMRRHAILEAGAYDPVLRAQNGEGCEDMMLYLRIAERYEFAVVTEHLTGYRRRRDSMSMNFLQMLRSRVLVQSRLRREYPQHARHIDAGYTRMCAWLFRHAVKARDFGSAAILCMKLLMCDPPAGLRILTRVPIVLVRRAAMFGHRRIARRAASLRTQAAAWADTVPPELSQ